MSGTDTERTVNLSDCHGAVFRATTLTLMTVACPFSDCGLSVGLADGVIASHITRIGANCPSAGTRVIDDCVARARA
jgi:hypothetical protein